MSWWWIAALVVVGLALFGHAHDSKAKRHGNGAEPPAPKPLPKRKPFPHADHHWPALGAFAFEVVGESHYQPALRLLAGEHGDAPASASHVAYLVPDDKNPHDASAVSVQIAGYAVGHLSRDDAKSFRRRLAQAKLTGKPTTCDALVVGGGLRNGERLLYGVVLDIKPFL